MSEPPEKKDPGEADRTDNHPSVRSVAVGAVSIVGAVGGTVAFVLGGWIALATAGAVVAAGGVVVARVKNPRPRGTRPGLLHALIGRPRRPGRQTGLGKLPWSLTGNQSRRARSKAASAGLGGTKSTGKRRTGNGLQLPALTKKGRAKRAAAHLATGGAGHRTSTGTAKKATAPRAATNRPGTKPNGTRAPRTPSHTPARAGGARRLSTAPGRTKAPTAGTRGPVRPRLTTATKRAGAGVSTRPSGGTKTSTSRGRGTNAARRTSRPGSSPRTGKPGVRPSTAARPVRRHQRAGGSSSSTSRRTGPRNRPGTNSSTRRRTTGPVVPRIRRNRPTGSPATNRRTTTGKRGATTNAKRLGDLTAPTRRRDHRTANKATPNRTTRRPRPTTKQPTTRLVRTAMRLPRRNGWKITRPSKVQQRSARRRLVLRGKVAGRRAATWAAKAPFKATAATAAWSWLHRPLWLYPMAPVAPDPKWSEPTIPDPKLSTSPGQKQYETKTRRNHRHPYPKVTARRAPATTTTKGTTTMSNPTEAAVDAASLIASYKTDSVLEFERFLQDQARVVQAMGQAYRTLAQRMVSEMPFAAPVGDTAADFGAGFLALEKMAAQMPATLRAAHQEQFAGIENPRPGQHMWDTQNNR